VLPSRQFQFARIEQDRCKARIKARLLGQPSLAPCIGRFELVRLLGQGSAGMVYEARDDQDDTPVALKLLRCADSREISRFKREFRALAGVSHDNLVHLHELFTDRHEWYFTMELVRGVTFTDHAHQLVTLDTEGSGVALEHALRQLLSAVRRLHEAHLVHCDLKPSNVLVTAEGRVVVLDFGLVRLIGELSDSGVRASNISGTPQFMAPELFEGHGHSPATDAYAIGVMLFQVLHGCLPVARQLVGTSEALQHKQDADARGVPPLPRITQVLQVICSGLLEPDPTRRLTIRDSLAQLRNTAGPSISASAPRHGAFVGRRRELAALHLALANTGEGLPIALFIAGPSGIGKSVLSERFVDELRGTALVLRGRCHEREALPYKAFDGVMDAVVEHLAGLHSERRLELMPPHVSALQRMFPCLCGVPGWQYDEPSALSENQAELRQQAFAAMKVLLGRLASFKPLVLMVDDLQWADVDSAQLLFEVLGPPGAPALLYVGCHRDEANARSDFLRELFAEAAATRWQCERRTLTLERLDDTDASQLARQLLASAEALPERTVERIVREAGGNPFFVSELALYFAGHAARDVATLSLPGLFAWRIALLSVTARDGLSLLALASRPMRAQLLANALVDKPDIDAALRLLLRSGLVRFGSNAEWVVYHDALREHVVHTLEPDSVGALHRRLALAYESARSAEPEWLIEHWRAASEPARALVYAIEAARTAAGNLAFNRAVELYEAALSLLEPDDRRGPQLQAELGDAHVNAGHSAAAAQAFLAAVQEGDEVTAVALRCRAVQHSFRSGQMQQGHAQLDQLLRQVGVWYPRSAPGLYAAIALSRARLAARKLRVLKDTNDAAAPHAASTAVLQSVFR